MTDLHIARRMQWTYPEVQALPLAVYDVLVEELVKEQDAD
jgi:hypothetical protein